MNVAKAKDENPHMKEADFDRIMREALQVAPPKGKEVKGADKTRKVPQAKKKR